jgi:hypothetical protein
MDAKRRARPIRLALVIPLLAWACGEPVTAPGIGEVSRPSLLRSDTASAPVTVLERTVPLGEEERASRTIGLLGGVLSLPRAGLTVVVPPGALAAPTTITVVAPAGGLVGYHFLPEGQTFLVPLALRQSLLRTAAAPGQDLLAAHFEGDLAAVVDGLELLTLDVLGVLGTFRVEHFSGYVIGTN